LFLVRWVATHIVPQEPAVRAALRRGASESDVDDLVQEAYCRFAAGSGRAYRAARAYFMQTVKTFGATNYVGRPSFALKILRKVPRSSSSQKRWALGRQWPRASSCG
jgi:hypothetical protein